MGDSVFPMKKLGPLCSKVGSGATPRGGSKVYLERGDVALIRSQNVRNEGFSKAGLVFIENNHANQLANVSVEANDVLLNITGDSVARCCQVDPGVLPARVNQHVAIIRPDPEQLDPRFLRSFLVSPEMQIQMLAWAGAGATRNALTKGMIESFDVPVPELPEQRAIAHILGSMNDKIELNRRMNETLEGMAQALFKSWFIDFDPVIDNAMAADNPIPEELQARAALRESLGDARKLLPEEVRSLFPSEFEHTEEMGWIPQRWEVGCLRDIADNPRRGVQAKDIYPGTPYIGLQDMPQRSISLSSWGKSDDVESGKFIFNQGEILFGKLRPYFHKVGIAPIDGVCSTDILVVIPKSNEWLSIVLGHVTSVEFIEYVTAASTGTRMPRTNWDDMGRYKVALPPKPLVGFASYQLQGRVDRILLNIDESRELSKLRDILLPKLLSGEIRVPEAEKLIESANGKGKKYEKTLT